MSESRSLVTRHVQQFVTQGDEKLLAVGRSLSKMDAARAREEAALARAYKQAGAAAVRATEQTTVATKKTTTSMQRKRAAALEAAKADRQYASSMLATARATLEEDRALKAANRQLAQHQAAQTRAAVASRGHARGVKESAGAMRGWVGTAAAFAGIAGIGGVIKSYERFDTSLRAVGAVSQIHGKQLAALGVIARKAGLETGVGAGAATEALVELAKAGLSASAIGPALSGTLRLAQAGGIATADAATAAADALQSFKLQGKDASMVADQLANAANLTTGSVGDFAFALSQGGSAAKLAGLSLQDTVLVLTELARIGVKGSDAGTSVKTAFLKLAKPTKQASAAMKEYGLTFYDAQGKIKPVADIADMLNRKLGGLTNQQKVATLQTLAGTRGFRALAAMMQIGGKGSVTLAKQLGVVGSATRTAKDMQSGFAGSLARLKATVEDISISLGDQFAPQIAKFADSLAAMGKDPAQRKKLMDDLNVGVSVVKDFASAAWQVVQVGAKLLGAFRGLPAPVKHAAIEFGLLYLITRKLGLASNPFSGWSKGLRNVRREAALTGPALQGIGGGPGGGRGRTGRLSRFAPGRAGVLGGLAAGAFGVSISGGDVLGSAASGAAAGMIAGPWGAAIGGISGALGSAVMGWINDHSKEAGARLGKGMAPGMAQSFQQSIGDLEVKRRAAEHSAKAFSGTQVAYGGKAGTFTVQANVKVSLEDRAKAVAAAREQGAKMAAAVRQGALAHGGRGMTVNDLTGNVLGKLQGLSISGRLAMARSVLAWTKGMESKGDLPKGAAARLAKAIAARFDDLGPLLGKSGAAGTEALAAGMNVPAAKNAAQDLLATLTHNYEGMPKAANKSAHATKVALVTAASELKAKLGDTNVTGKYRKNIEDDLAAVRRALHKLSTAGSADAATTKENIKAALQAIADRADGARSSIGQLIDKITLLSQQHVTVPITGSPLVDPITPTPHHRRNRRPRRGGLIFQGGGQVPIVASGGEVYLDRGTVGAYEQAYPGALGAVERMQAPHFNGGGHIKRYALGGAVIPGPSDRDATPMLAQPGAFILTGHGQQLLAGMTGGGLYKGGGSVLHAKRHTFSIPELVRLALTAGFSRKSGSSPTAAAVAMAESSGQPWQVSHNAGPPASDDKGLWQINSYYNRKDLPADWNDPLSNARAARKIFNTNSNGGWRDWTTYKNGLHQKFMGAALSAARTATPYTGADSVSTGGTGSRTSLSDDLHGMSARMGRRNMWQIRQSSVPDAFTQGYDSGRAGETDLRYAGSLLSDISAAARVNVTSKTTSTRSRTSSSASGSASTGGSGTTMMDGKPVAKWIARILQTARSAGTSFRVSSGFRSFAEQTRLWNQLGRDPRVVARPGTSNHEGSTFPRGAADLEPGWENMVAYLRKHPSIPLHHYNEPRDPYHFSHSGHRRGGRIRAYARGGPVLVRQHAQRSTFRPMTAAATTGAASGSAAISRQLGKLFSAGTRANGHVTDALDALNRLLGNAETATVSRLTRLARSLDKAIQGTIAKSSPGGARITKGEAALIRRARGAKSLVQAQLGVRAGTWTKFADEAGQRIDDRLAGFDRRQRTAGIDPSSSAGLAAQGNSLDYTRMQTEGQRSALQHALSIASKAGRAGRSQAVELTKSIHDLDQGIADLAVQRIENARAQIETAAQERVNLAAHGTTLASTGLQNLELRQRLSGTFDGGGSQRRDFILQSVVPALQSELAALQQQQVDAGTAGDPVLALQVGEAVAAKQNDVLQAQLDAQEAIKENTDPKQVGGTLAFQAGNETLTDAIVLMGSAG